MKLTRASRRRRGCWCRWGWGVGGIFCGWFQSSSDQFQLFIHCSIFIVHSFSRRLCCKLHNKATSFSRAALNLQNNVKLARDCPFGRCCVLPLCCAFMWKDLWHFQTLIVFTLMTEEVSGSRTAFGPRCCVHEQMCFLPTSDHFVHHSRNTH